MVATKNDKIVAVKGDPAAPVNRGLNCIKGYFNAKIMYGEDRLTKPLLRLNATGEFDKKGKFAPVSWKRAFDEIEKHMKKALKELGPTGIGVFGSGQYTVQEGYAAVKLIKAGEPIEFYDEKEKMSWRVHPFLFEAKRGDVKIDWEHTEYKWIYPEEIVKYETVPKLKDVIFNLLEINE